MPTNCHMKKGRDIQGPLMGLFWMIFSEICFFVCIQACRKKLLETCLILVSNFWTSRRGEDHWWGSINLSCPKNAYLIFVNLEPVISCNWIYTQKNQKVPSTCLLYILHSLPVILHPSLLYQFLWWNSFDNEFLSILYK